MAVHANTVTLPEDMIFSTSLTAGAQKTAIIQSDFVSADTVRAELTAGLLAPNAHTSPKYLYDALGSKLFEAICELPEYYPTRTEAEILDRHLDSIVASVGRGATLIDLGASNCAKAAKLFPLLLPAHYVPIDISVDHLREALANLQRQFPQVAMTGIGLDFSRSFELPGVVPREKRLYFYPGSSIGNFMPHDAQAFLRRLRESCDADGGLLIGIDLLKDKRILDAAYDDSLGVTAAFNLNLLRHLNHLLGTDFNVYDWQHRAFFDAELGRIEMHLEAQRDLRVCWADGERHFQRGERIHTENSYKYDIEKFLELLQQTGFGEARVWTDARNWFALIHAKALAL